MSAVFVVLPLALLVVLAAIAAFGWAARRGQFDDLDTPALRMLHDDEERRVTPPPTPTGDPAGEAKHDGEPPVGGASPGPGPGPARPA